MEEEKRWFFYVGTCFSASASPRDLTFIRGLFTTVGTEWYLACAQPRTGCLLQLPIDKNGKANITA